MQPQTIMVYLVEGKGTVGWEGVGVDVGFLCRIVTRIRIGLLNRVI